jgi:hypothetical protein
MSKIPQLLPRPHQTAFKPHQTPSTPANKQSTQSIIAPTSAPAKNTTAAGAFAPAAAALLVLFPLFAVALAAPLFPDCEPVAAAPFEPVAVAPAPVDTGRKRSVDWKVWQLEEAGTRGW